MLARIIISQALLPGQRTCSILHISGRKNYRTLVDDISTTTTARMGDTGDSAIPAWPTSTVISLVILLATVILAPVGWVVQRYWGHQGMLSSLYFLLTQT